MIVPHIKLKSAKKGKILLACVVSISTAKNALKSVLEAKENLRSDLSTISNLIRDEKFVDFYQIGKYFEDSALAGCLKLFGKKKSSKCFCSVCQCTTLKKLPKVHIAKFILKFGIASREEQSFKKYNLTTRQFGF